jgi:hypothetical protein
MIRRKGNGVGATDPYPAKIMGTRRVTKEGGQEK